MRLYFCIIQYFFQNKNTPLGQLAIAECFPHARPTMIIDKAGRGAVLIIAVCFLLLFNQHSFFRCRYDICGFLFLPSYVLFLLKCVFAVIFFLQIYKFILFW
jgi:hypothetical protein